MSRDEDDEPQVRPRDADELNGCNSQAKRLYRKPAVGTKPTAGGAGEEGERGRREAPEQGQRRARAAFIVSSGISCVTNERFPAGAEPTT